MEEIDAPARIRDRVDRMRRAQDALAALRADGYGFSTHGCELNIFNHDKAEIPPEVFSGLSGVAVEALEALRQEQTRAIVVSRCR